MSKRVKSLRAHLRVIAPAGKTAALFEETLQRWRAVGNLVSIWPARDLNLKPLISKTNALRLDQLADRRTNMKNLLWYIAKTNVNKFFKMIYWLS